MKPTRRLSEDAFDTARSYGGAQPDAGLNIAPELISSPSKGYKDKEERKHPDSPSKLPMQSKQSALKLAMIKRFCQVTCDNSTALNNQKFGIGVLGFYGTVTIKNTQCNENETDGMVFSKNMYSPHVVGSERPNEEEYLDYLENSMKTPTANHNRSRSIMQPTENAMMEGY